MDPNIWIIKDIFYIIKDNPEAVAQLIKDNPDVKDFEVVGNAIADQYWRQVQASFESVRDWSIDINTELNVNVPQIKTKKRLLQLCCSGL